MHAFDHLWAHDLDTGELAWSAESKVRFRHGMGSPVLLNLPVPGGARRTEAFIYLWTGDLVRVRDGKIMQRDLMYSFFPSMTSDRRDTLYISTMPENCVEHRNFHRAGLRPQIPPTGRRGTRALRFVYEGPETVTWRKLWFNDEIGLGNYPLLLRDRLYLDAGSVTA